MVDSRALTYAKTQHSMNVACNARGAVTDGNDSPLTPLSAVFFNFLLKSRQFQEERFSKLDTDSVSSF